MASMQASGSTQPRLYIQPEDFLRPTLREDTSSNASYYANSHTLSLPAVDDMLVENSILQPATTVTTTTIPPPEILESKVEAVLEDTQLSAMSVAESLASSEMEVPAVVELASAVNNPEKQLPHSVKTSLLHRIKSHMPQYKNTPSLASPLSPVAGEDQPRGQYVPPSTSPYPSLDYNPELPVVEEPRVSDETVESYPNPFKTSCSVLRLSGGLFDEFLKQMDVVLVMFYKGALGQQGSREKWSKEQFVKASERTNRTNHAYAAVDCSKENSICSREAVKSFPLFRLYSKGHTVDTIRNYQSFDSDTMQKFVEFSPVLEPKPRNDGILSSWVSPSQGRQALN